MRGDYNIRMQQDGEANVMSELISPTSQAHNNLQPYQTAYIWKLISYSN